jgi:hypothetical protein
MRSKEYHIEIQMHENKTKTLALFKDMSVPFLKMTIDEIFNFNDRSWWNIQNLQKLIIICYLGAVFFRTLSYPLLYMMWNKIFSLKIKR